MIRAHIALVAIILLEIFLVFIGCQSGKGNPMQVGTGPEAPSVMPGDTTTEPGDESHGKGGSVPALWGLYRVTYSAETHEIGAVPLRGAAFAFNVVKFLQPPKGSISGMTLGVLDDSKFPSEGLIDVRIILHHPFPGDSTYTGFDVSGIFLTESSLVAPHNSSLWYADGEQDPTLLNADGWTRWMNPTEFLSGDLLGFEPGWWGTSESSENSGFVAGATLNPYKYYAQGLSPDETLREWLQDPSSVSDRGIFRSGGTCARDYYLQFPKAGDRVVFFFDYAVLANWAQPSVIPPQDPLEDFPPEANAGWPLHVLVNDESDVYYTTDEAGGELEFELDVFDWGGLTNPNGVAGEVSKFVVWSNEPLVPGGWVELEPMEVEWNSGFTASTSVAQIEIDGASPERSGETEVWIELQSLNPRSYDQGLGAIVPDDPLAAYVRIPVEVKACPKAGASEMESGEADSGDYLDDVVIHGEDFVPGADLGAWLELIDAGGGGGETGFHTIEATNVKYVDEDTITADFDLAEAPYGDYGLGCTNGCGVTTTPEENAELGLMKKLEINLKCPLGVELTTDRGDSEPRLLSTVTVSWEPVREANYYRVYAKVYDINGNLVLSKVVLGTAWRPYYVINLPMLPTGASGIIETWITALPDPSNWKYESRESAHGFAYLQDFEIGMGQWTLRSERTDFRLIRSTVDTSASGYWGLKEYGHAPSYPACWAMLASPAIEDVEGADTVHVEFLHRWKDINENNGYQLGWLHTLPDEGDPIVNEYFPIAITSYGQTYDDTACPALEVEYGCSPTTDNNFQNNATMWEGWWLSGFDASEVLGDGLDNYIVIGVAVTEYDTPHLCVDDIAILVY